MCFYNEALALRKILLGCFDKCPGHHLLITRTRKCQLEPLLVFYLSTFGYTCQHAANYHETLSYSMLKKYIYECI